MKESQNIFNLLLIKLILIVSNLDLFIIILDYIYIIIILTFWNK